MRCCCMGRVASASDTSRARWRRHYCASHPRSDGRLRPVRRLPTVSPSDNHPDLRWLMPASICPSARRRRGRRCPGRADLDDQSLQSQPRDPIDQVRDIGDFLALASHRGGRRVVVLTPAEALNAPAANALLKMLEEPPRRAVFIAVSDAIDAVLPTVRSRCVLLRAPVPEQRRRWPGCAARGIDDAEEAARRSRRRAGRS